VTTQVDGEPRSQRLALDNTQSAVKFARAAQPSPLFSERGISHACRSSRSSAAVDPAFQNQEQP